MKFRIRYQWRASAEDNWSNREVNVTGAEATEQYRKDISESVNTRNIRVNVVAPTV